MLSSATLAAAGDAAIKASFAACLTREMLPFMNGLICARLLWGKNTAASGLPVLMRPLSPAGCRGEPDGSR